MKMIFRQRTVYGGSIWIYQFASIPNFPSGKIMSVYREGTQGTQHMTSCHKMDFGIEEMPRKSYCWSNRS